MKNAFFFAQPVVALGLVSVLTLAACEGGLRVETGEGSATTQATPSYDIRTAIEIEYTRTQRGYVKVQDDQRLKFTKIGDGAMYDRRFSADFIYYPSPHSDFPLELTISNVKTRVRVPVEGETAAVQPEAPPVSLRFAFRHAKIDTTKTIICSSNLSDRVDMRAVESGCRFDASNAAFKMDIPVEEISCRLRITSQANLDFSTMPQDGGMVRLSFPSSRTEDTVTGKSFAMSIFCHRRGTQIVGGHFLHNAYVAPY